MIRLLDSNTSDLWFDLHGPIRRDLEVHLGESTGDLVFACPDGRVKRNLKITGGSSDQRVALAFHGLAVDGNMSVDLGGGHDILATDELDLSVGRNLKLVGVNRFDNEGALTVGSNFLVNTRKEVLETRLRSYGSMQVLGDFKFRGGPAIDSVSLSRGAAISGHVKIHLGSAPIDSTDQYAFLFECQVGGNVEMRSKANAAYEEFEVGEACRVVGRIRIDGHGGHNFVSLRGVCEGKSIRYEGGTATDIVRCDLSGPNAGLRIDLGPGLDRFDLLTGALLRRATLDFGSGVDEYHNDLPVNPAPFRVKLENLP